MKARIRMFKFKVSHKFSKKRDFPLDEKQVAILLRYYTEKWLGEDLSQGAEQPAQSQQIFTQIPDTHVPQNPNVKSEPSLNIRAPVVAGPNILNPPLGKRPLPIQAQQDLRRENA